MKGYRLTNKQFFVMVLDEIDKATVLPNNFDEILIPFMKKPVSTIPDECKGVRLEIGTSLKRETAEIAEDIVSADGNIG